MTTLKWAILGTGNIANSFAKAFAFASEKVELYAVASRNGEKAFQFAEQYRIPNHYGSYEELLADPAVDVVYVATPHSHHYRWIKASLNAGKHVLSEKVITINRALLDEVVELAEQKGLYVAEAMTIYHMPLYPRLKAFAVEQELGPLKMINAMFGSRKELDSNKYFFKKELAGGALFDIGTYALTFARTFLSSKPTEVKTIGTLHESGVDDNSSIILRNEQGEMATVSLSFLANMPNVGIVAYERGYFTISNYPRANQAVFTDLEGKEQVIQAGETIKALSYEIDDFSDMVLGKAENKTLEYTRDVLEIMDQVRPEWGLEYPGLE